MLASISYGDQEFQYQVVRNPALTKRTRIHVYPDGSVEVEAPPSTDDVLIRTALRNRARWVLTQLRSKSRTREHVLTRAYVSGETHFYLGRRYVLKVEKSQEMPRGVTLKGGKFQVVVRDGWPGEVRDLLSLWYKRRAKEYLPKRLRIVSEGLPWIDTPPELALRKMKSQWGNCRPSGVVQLNPVLVRAPRECIDYVILHELCHLVGHNHSKRFYALLQRQLPNWRRVKARLDGMAELLLAE